MAHNHDDQSQSNMRRVQFALILTAAFMVIEVIGGIVSGSLALLADAGHMLTDSMALALAAFAFRVSSKPADSRRSYGYQRFQILAAFVNGLSLLVVVGWILFEAVVRLMAPPAVMGDTMLIVASAGLVVNLLSFIVLHGGDRDNMNIRGAALHVAGDLLGSVAAMIAALVIIYTGWMPIDPLLSILVALLILRSAWQLVQRSAHILLEGAPEWLDIAAMKTKIVSQVPAVKNIHHVHVWGLTPQHLMLTMHVAFVDVPPTNTPVIREIKRVLREEFGIKHSTIEVEADDCADH
jgi:cobalt-zinc-cadmium efflux system protein